MTYRSNIQTKPVSFEALAREFPRDLGCESWYQNTSIPGLPGGENCVILRSLVLSQILCMTDGRTDTPPIPISHSSIDERDKNAVIPAVSYLTVTCLSVLCLCLLLNVPTHCCANVPFNWRRTAAATSAGSQQQASCVSLCTYCHCIRIVFFKCYRHAQYISIIFACTEIFTFIPICRDL